MKCVIGDKMGDGSKADWTCDKETENKDGVCASCKAAGWSTDPHETAMSVAADPVLRNKVGIISPIQPDNLTT